MGWRRDKEDGELIEVPSHVEPGGNAEVADKRAVDMVGGRGGGHGADRAAAGDAARDRLGVDTTPAGGRFGVRTTPAGERQSDADLTRVHLPGSAARRDGGGAGARVGGLAVRPASGHGDPPASVDGDPMDDPPVGWLVIVAGPGRGRVATLGNNRNFIGRDRGQRVSLDYGDDTISREGHGEIRLRPEPPGVPRRTGHGDEPHLRQGSGGGFPTTGSLRAGAGAPPAGAVGVPVDGQHRSAVRAPLRRRLLVGRRE